MSDPTSSSPAPRAPLGRLAVTIALPLAVILMPPIGLPGVDTTGLPGLATSPYNFDVFAVGVAPFLTASVLVELGALLSPRWRALRHGGPEGRGKLGRAALIVGGLLCLSQSFGFATLMANISDIEPLGSISVPLVALTMMAGSCLLVLVAQLAGVYGLAGGLALLSVAAPVTVAIRQIRAGDPVRQRSPLDMAAIAILSAAVAVVTWYVLRPPRAPSKKDAADPTYREAPGRERRAPLAIPSPASGVTPVMVGASLLAMAAKLPALWLPGNEIVYRGVLLVVTLLAGAGLAWAFSDPARVAAIFARAAEGASADEIEVEARAAQREAILRSLAYLVALFAIGGMGQRFSGLVVAPSTLALATAAALDVAAELRARRAIPDLVPVWPEHRSYAVPAAREALAAAGIQLHARGERLHRMLQFFGPYVPIDLMVPRADEARATEILKDVLRAHPEKKGEVARAPRDTAPRRWTRTETSLLGAVVLLSVGTMILPTATPLVRETRTPAQPRTPVTLQILPLDDDASPFDDIQENLPRGASIQIESVPLGPSRGTDPRNYVRLVKLDGETLDQARARLLAWAEQRSVPAGDRVLAGALTELDEQSGNFEQIGWRTYVVKTQTIIDGSHVRDASAVSEISRESWGVWVELSPEGAERFRAFTAANIKRRAALVVDGIVVSAPVIQSEIPGGRVRVTMGTGSPEQQERDARALERRLLGR